MSLKLKKIWIRKKKQEGGIKIRIKEDLTAISGIGEKKAKKIRESAEQALQKA